jgi:flagellar biosynthetic protein FliR
MVPVFGDKSIPKLIKIGLVLILSLILMPTIPAEGLSFEITSLWQLMGYVFNEILIGLIIGLFFRFIFIGVMIGGAIIGYQIGFMFAMTFDNNQAAQVSIISRFWYIIAVLFFLSISGHHLIINAFAESFEVIPLGNFNNPGVVGEMIMRYSAYMFIIAIKIASPIMITLFLIDISLGTIAKMMPTMNVFFVGMPIKNGVGIMMMAMSLPLFIYVIEKTLTYFDSGLRELLYTIGKA